MTKSEQINELASALAKAQGEIRGALKDSQNPFFKSSYADLASVWEACREPLTRNGLSVYQGAESLVVEGNWQVCVETILMHSSGQWISSRLHLTPTDGKPQSFGSAVTYGRRYGLQSAVGVSPEDDDGNAASGRNGSKQNWEEQRKAQATVAAKKIESLKQQVESSKALPLDQQLTGPQRNKLYAESADAGRDLHAWIKEKYGFDSVKQIHKDKLDSVIDDLRKAAIPKTKSKAGEGQPLATPENQVQQS